MSSHTPPTHTPATSTLIFAGGGTGGHIYPALAIAGAARALAPHTRAIFVCSRRPLDAEILRERNEPFEPSPAEPFGVRPRTLFRFVRAWGPAVAHARRLIQTARETGAVRIITTGGFVAGPMARAAQLEGADLTMVNLDAVPGRANRWIARRASRSFTSARVDPMPRGWTQIAPIVRPDAISPLPAQTCRESLGLSPAQPVLLVTGGSQGAQSINRLLLAILEREPALLTVPGWQVVHQSGKSDTDTLTAAYAKAGVRALVRPFFHDMGPLWKSAELAICRSGAGNIAEIWASKTPALVLPYPYHADDHQRANAVPLRDARGVAIATDLIDPSKNFHTHRPALADLLLNAASRADMRRALEALGPADGAAAIARAITTTQ